jgi:hypothetical protein
MKTIKLNRESWHYKLSDMTPGFNPHRTDICGYPWRVFFGMIIFMICLALGSFVTYVVGDTFAWAIACIVNWIWMDPEGHAAFIGFFVISMTIAMVIGVGLVFFVTFLFEEFSNSDNFLTHAYAAHKEKFCAKIEFVDK